jgi:hypothetical protein
VTGNSWGCKKVSGYKTIIFFGLVAAYLDRLCCSIFTHLYAVIGRVLPQSIHKLLKSYPQKKEKTPCFFLFLSNPKENTQAIDFVIVYFSCLEDKYVDNYTAARGAG